MIEIHGSAAQQKLIVTFDEADLNAVPAFSIKAGVGINPSGSMRLPRFGEIKRLLRSYIGLVALCADLEVDFRAFTVTSDDLTLSSGPRQKSKDKEPIPDGFLCEMLDVAWRIRDRDVALTFWKRGCDHIDDGQPLEAFFHFWFFLEYSFGNGKWRTSQLKDELLKSAVLKKAISLAQRKIDTRVAEMLTEKQKKIFMSGSTDLVIGELTDFRGKLHHSKPKLDWHPDEPESFRFEAHFLAMVCQMCVGIYGSERDGYTAVAESNPA
jgi:hypothetical protein